MTPLFAFFNLGPMEIVVILVLGVLLFGRRLPQVGNYLGKSIIEFKKGMHGLEDNLDMNAPLSRAEQPAAEQIRAPQRVAPAAPKFEDNSTAISAPPQV